MPISSVNSGPGLKQVAQNAVMSPRTKAASAQPALEQAATPTAALTVTESVTNGDATGNAATAGAPIPHPFRVGVAAYVAIMNPQSSTSMRVEA
jgi:hypothetical protein